jgi:hypothetical protein
VKQLNNYAARRETPKKYTTKKRVDDSTLFLNILKN